MEWLNLEGIGDKKEKITKTKKDIQLRLPMYVMYVHETGANTVIAIIRF
jgi:hypothetical protein